MSEEAQTTRSGPSEDPPLSEDAALLELLASAIEFLPTRHQLVISMRFGLHGQASATLAETGAALGVSRERARQLQQKALGRVKGKSGRDLARIRKEGQHIPDDFSLLLADDMLPSGVRLTLACTAIIRRDRDPVVATCDWSLRSGLLPPYSAGYLLIHLARGVARKDLLRDFRQAIGIAAHEYERKLRKESLEVWRRQQFADHFLARTYWPSSPRTIPDLSRFHTERFPETDLSFESSLHGRKVQCDSRLEVEFLTYLETFPQVKGFVEQPLRLMYRTGAKSEEQHSYIPDLAVLLEDGRCVIVEIKALQDIAVGINLDKWLSLANLCRSQGFGFFIGDRRHGLSDFLDQTTKLHNPAVYERLAAGPLYWPEAKALTVRLGARSTDWQRLVLDRGLWMSLRPFRSG